MRNLLPDIAALGATNIVATALVIDGNPIALMSAVASTVGLTLAVVKWIDGRIDHKIRNYSNTVKWQFRIILREISNVRELNGHPPLNIPAIESEEKEKAG